MAAAVSDFRPKATEPGKIRRNTNKNLMIELEPTPDLLASCAQRRTDHQLLIGFALEPRDRLEASAREKLERKRVDIIVANPLETMDSPDIDATLLARPGIELRERSPAGGKMDKGRFAAWLVEQIEHAHASAMNKRPTGEQG